MTYGDLRDENLFRQVLQFSQADVIIHIGETGLLKITDKNSLEVISKSVVGTAVMMELLKETASVRSVVVVSSDKVYAKNLENKSLSETDKIGAQAILPTAKLCSELIALSYRTAFFCSRKIQQA